MKRPLSHWLLLFGLVAMWGSAFLLIKVAVTELAPSVVVAGRLVIAALVLLTAVVYTRRSMPRSPLHYGYFVALAIVGNCLPFWLIAWGEQHVGAGIAGILMAIMPLTTLLLARWTIAGERFDAKRITGFVLGFLGIVVLVGPDAILELQGAGTVFWAQAAILGAAICYAINTIVARHRPKTDSLVAATGTLIAASLIMVPITALAGEAYAIELGGKAAIAVLALGLVSTALATVTFFKLIDVAGPTFLSLINYLIPLWALLGSMLFLGEKAEWRALAALALILSGIALAEYKRR